MRVHLLIAAIFVSACGGGKDSTTTPPGSNNKTIDVFTLDRAFSPTFTTISVGDTVRWNFTPSSEGQGHNVRFSPPTTGAPADINILKSGTATRIFTAAGTFSYVCDVHPGMNAQVVVQ